ncbi:MAG: PA14 domain-containing protein, partial [Planctomycetota bacterium]
MSWWRGLLSLLLIAAAGSAAPGAPWWDDAWSARHRLRVPYRMAPHVDAVAVDMTTFGWLTSGGADLRVVSRDGDLCPHRIFEIGPGDRVRFLFRPVGGHDVFYAYFGNPHADPPGETLAHKAGVVLEVGDLPAGRYNRAREVLDLWSRATVRGTMLRPQVFDGTNPTGPSDRFIARYTGHFVVPDRGTYRFCTASSDASIVLVDGQLVAQWGGAHHAHPGRRGRFGGTIDLDPGVHRIEYLWVKASTHPAASVLGWQEPGSLALRLMPPRAFLQARGAIVDPVELRRGAALADFTWTPLHHLDRDGMYAVAYVFRQATGAPAKDALFKWKFGDGTTAKGRTVRKVFFGTGRRRVTLTVAHRGAVLSGALDVDVAPIWTQTRTPGGKHLRDYQSACQALRIESASASELAAVIALADDLKANDRLDRLWDALVRHREAATDPRVARVAAYLGRRFQQPPYCSLERAEQALRFGLRSGVEDRETRASLTQRLADIHVNGRGQADRAEVLLDTLKRETLKPIRRRISTILMGDIAAQRGAFEDAAKLYEQAGSTARPWDRKTAIRKAAVLFSTQDFVRRREFEGAVDTMASWLLVQPDERLDPHCLLLLGKAHAGCGSREKALVLFERALRIDPRGTDAPQL